MDDTLLNELMELFELTDNDLAIASNIIEANNGDKDACIRNFKDMGFGANVELPDTPDPNAGLRQVQDVFLGDDILTQSVICNAFTGKSGNVGETIEMLFNIRNDNDAVDKLRNGTAEEVRNLEASLQRRENEKQRQRQQELLEEIEREKRRIIEYKEKLKVIDIPEDVEKKVETLLETSDSEVVPVERTDSTVEVEFTPMPEPSIEESLLDSIVPVHNVREIVRRLEETGANIQEKEKVLEKLVEENAKCTLSVTVSNAEIAVTYRLKEVMEPSEFDWIGMHMTDRPNRSYLRYMKTGGKQSGTLFFPKPRAPGLYHFRFFPGGSYLNVATSDTVYIGPKLDMEATYEDNIASLNWTVKSEDTVSGDDWFGLYRTGSSNKNYIQAIKAKDNNIEFTVPLKQGEYEIRFFPYQCGYVNTQTSNVITVEGEDSIPIELVYDGLRIIKILATPDINSVAEHKNDWIGLYKVGSSNKSYRYYQYVDLANGSVEFDAPKKSGTYDLRYFSSSSSRYEDLVRSEKFDIQDTDVLEIEIVDNTIQVSWDIHSVEQTTYDWIGLYKASEINNKNYIQSVYVDIKKSNTIIPFPTAAGHYEIRYFASNVGKYADFKKSPIFSISQ